jgi:NNP family nitrate/nitrite transporter-like MFS transporter
VGAFGGFVFPPILGAVVAAQGAAGYSHGFILFIILAALSLLLAGLFQQPAAASPQPRPAARD